tara:strand:+ start:192 stop:2036 length:1845 start_codon:yes stop_codon:yes gene_type:complete
MAQILEVKTVVDTTEGLSSIDKLVAKMDEFVDVSKESIENQKKFGKAGEKAGKDTSKGTSLASKGFKKLGDIIKINPLGLLVGTVGLLVAAFKSNQKVMDVFTNVLGTISAVGTQVANVVGDVVGKISDATGGFDKLTKVAKGLLTIALTPIKVSFYSLTLGLQEAQLAFEESFLGDKDPETIKELNKSIVITKANLVGVAQDVVGAGSAIVENFAGAISEIGQVAEGVVEGVKEISIEATYETVKANTQLQKSAELAEAGIRGLIEKYDLQAEKLRQIRDDDKKTFAERIKANEDLGEKLKEQQEEQLKLAQISIDAANAKLALDKTSQEALVELKNAENEYAATLAQVAGFEAEQLTNKNSLLREQKQIVDELALVGKEEFERKIVEAEQERNQRLLDAELAIIDEQAKKDALAAIEKEYQSTITQIKKDEAVKVSAAQKVLDDKEAARKQGQANMAMDIAQTTISTLASFAKKGSKQAKNMAIAQGLMDTFKGAQSAFAAANANVGATAGTFGAYPIAMAAAATAVGLANVAKIKSTNPESGGGGGGGGGSNISAPRVNVSDTPRIPNFNSTNQGVGGGGFGSIRAVVVQQDIKDSASLDNRVDDLVKIGK